MVDALRIMNPIPPENMKIVMHSPDVDHEMYMAVDDRHKITVFSPCLLFQQGQGWSGIKAIDTIKVMVTGHWTLVDPPESLDVYGLEYPATIIYDGILSRLEETKKSMGWV